MPATLFVISATLRYASAISPFSLADMSCAFRWPLLLPMPSMPLFDKLRHAILLLPCLLLITLFSR